MTTASVYVVEDEAAIAMELCDILRSLGYDVLGKSARGERALLEIEEREPDLVLMDIRLSGSLTGIDVARGLREGQRDSSVVFLTAFCDDELLRQAGEVEPAGYLVKPIDKRELHATLQMAWVNRIARHERRALVAAEKRLLRERKEESLGRMAGALAHSFSNNLGCILGLTELALLSVGEPEECAGLLTESISEVGRAAELCGSLRQYAAAERGRPIAFELGELCRRATALIKTVVRDPVGVSIRVPEVGPLVDADPKLVLEALMQLVTNAAEAMAGRRGEVTVMVETVLADDLAAGRTWPAEWDSGSKTWPCLTVRDEGGGVAEADLDRIFDPFFSTKSVGRGLGLTLVLAAVRPLGGAVSVETGPRGSTFRMLLPAQERS